VLGLILVFDKTSKKTPAQSGLKFGGDDVIMKLAYSIHGIFLKIDDVNY